MGWDSCSAFEIGMATHYEHRANRDKGCPHLVRREQTSSDSNVLVRQQSPDPWAAGDVPAPPLAPLVDAAGAVFVLPPLVVSRSLSPSNTVNLTSPPAAELELFPLAVPDAVGLSEPDADCFLGTGLDSVPPADGAPALFGV